MSSKWKVPTVADVQDLFASCPVQPEIEEAVEFFDLMQLNNVHIARELEDYPLYEERPSDNNLHVAARLGAEEVALWLIKLKPELMNEQNLDGRTPMHVAILNKQFAIVKLLMEYGADITIADKNQWTPLMFACNFIVPEESIRLVKNFLKKNHKVCTAANMEGWTPLHVVCRSGDVTILSRLVLEYPNSVYLKTKNGLTAFHIAAMYNNHDTLNFLVQLTADDFNINTLDSMNETALHKAVRGNHLEMVRLLIKMGARLGVANVLGHSLVHIAAANGCVDIMRFLKEQQTEAAHELGKKVEQQRNLTKQSQLEDITNYIYQSKRLEKMSGELANLEWNVNKRDLDQNTALHLATFSNQKLAIQWLLAMGANTALKNRYGIDVADISNRLEMV